jgi:hypothetical protein
LSKFYTLADTLTIDAGDSLSRGKFRDHEAVGEDVTRRSGNPIN